MILPVVFWILLALLVYTYLGYALLLFVLVKIKRIFISDSKNNISEIFEPEVSEELGIQIPIIQKKRFSICG